LDDPEVREFLKRIRERFPEVKRLAERGVSQVEKILSKVGEKLTPKQRTELLDILTLMPPTCEVTDVRKVGLIRKRLRITIECRDKPIEIDLK